MDHHTATRARHARPWGTALGASPAEPGRAHQPKHPGTDPPASSADDPLRSRPVPEIDGDGLLRYEDRWVALTDLQVPVVALLLANLGKVVPLDEIARCYAAQGGSTAGPAIRSLTGRIAERLERIGATVYFVRPGGGMLVVLPDEADQGL